ncbi:hypothetical protein ACHAWT_009999 [Skeletonema menzelii]
MFRHGKAKKRGEAIIAPGAKNQPAASHHSAVHSILHGNTGDDYASSSPAKRLSRRRSQSGSDNNSGGDRNNSDVNTNNINSDNRKAGSSCGGSDDESSTTSLTIGSNGSFKKRSTSIPQSPGRGGSNSNNNIAKGGNNNQQQQQQQQFPPPPRPVSHSFSEFSEKRSYSFDVGNDQDKNMNTPVVMKSNSFNGGRNAGAGRVSLSPQSPHNRRSSEPSSPTEDRRIIGNADNKIPLRRLSSHADDGDTVNGTNTEVKKQISPPPFSTLSRSDSDRQIQSSIQRAAEMRNPTQSDSKLHSRIRSLSPRGVAASTSPIQQQRYKMGQQFALARRGRSMGRDMREEAMKDMEKLDSRFENNDANRQQPQQKQQRGRESSLSRLGNAISRGRSRRKQHASEKTYHSPEKTISSSQNDEVDVENQQVQASLMAVQMQPPPSPQPYSPLVSMPKEENKRSSMTHSTLSEPLSQEGGSGAGASQDTVNGLGIKQKKSRRQRMQSSLMKHLRRSSSIGSRSFGRREKLKHRKSDSTPVTDGSSTDRSGDVPTNDSEGSKTSRESGKTVIRVYEDSSSLHRMSSTGTASTTVSAMLPNLNAENSSDKNLDWNPSMSLLNRMSELQRIESFSGEEDSDYSESQNGNVDLEMDEIFYDPEEAYQSCAHALFQKEMNHVEELDLSEVQEDSTSKYKKGKFLYRRSVDNMVNGMKKNNTKSESASSQSDLSEAKDKKKVRSRSLSLRRIITRGSVKKREKREAALRQAMMHSQQYQELKKQQQEAEEAEHREKIHQRSMSVDAHHRGPEKENRRSSNPRYSRSNSLPRNADIAHTHALAALAAEASRRHRDSSKDYNQRKFARRNSKDPYGRRASFESETSRTSSSRSHSRHKEKCIVCRHRVDSSREVKFMDFHFCVECFRCASCRKPLGELDADDPFLSGAQLISNARGSVVQCGGCVMQLGRLKSEPFVPKPQQSEQTVVSYITTKGESSSTKFCTLCKSDFSGYKGEVQCIGVNNYHTECLRREKGRVDSIGSKSLGSENAGDILGQITPPSSIAGDLLTPAAAAQDVADKAIVRIALADDDGHTETTHMSNVFFVWSEKEEDLAEFEANEQDKKMEKFLRNDGCEIDLSIQVKYKLDMMKHQHNQFLTLPQLESDADGRITEKFQIELDLPDLPNGVVPQPSGPALLSIEPFPREQDSAMKVMRSSWSYECEGIQHEFRFIAPFNSPYGVAWEIFEGDELDFTSCKLECFIDNSDDHGTSETSCNASETSCLRRKSSKTSTSSLCDWEIRAGELMDEVDVEKNDAKSPTAEKKHLIDTSTGSRTSTEYSEGGSMLILHRKSRRIDPDREENDHFSELLSVASSPDSYSISLPSIMFIVVEKHSHDEIGLSLIEKNGTTVVSEVSKSGLFRSKLNEGCEILSINGHKVTSPRSFIRMMKDITGQVTVMASSGPSPPGAKFIVVTKPLVDDEDEEQDISFQKLDGILRVEGIKSAGIFAETDISKGDLCLSINGVPAISENVAMRAWSRAQGNAALLIFPMSNFWRSMVELTIEAKYDRCWKSSSECVLFLGNDNAHPINLLFDPETALCTIQDKADSDVEVKNMNTIIHRLMKLIKESIQSYITTTKNKRDSSRSLSVSPSGKLQSPSDVYKRALVKIDEMRENGRLSEAEYASAKRALTENAINMAK